MTNQKILQCLQSNCAYINRCVVESATEYHTHNFVEIAYVAEGCGHHLIGGKEYTAVKGDLWLINYDVAH
ncbi:MAG: AraC family ligand binding domain-containing protein [Clostridia bacterium]|nr:AraC family ligand binding domain-containing protein [Clostridia bacterium]